MIVVCVQPTTQYVAPGTQTVITAWLTPVSAVVVVVIRLARRDDLPALREVERAAGAPFRDVGMDAVADDEPPSIEELAVFQQDGRAWVGCAGRISGCRPTATTPRPHCARPGAERRPSGSRLPAMAAASSCWPAPVPTSTIASGASSR